MGVNSKKREKRERAKDTVTDIERPVFCSFILNVAVKESERENIVGDSSIVATRGTLPGERMPSHGRSRRDQ